MLPNSLVRQGWKPFHVWLTPLFVAAGVYATRDAWLDIYERATGDPESSHIYLVPIVALWMVLVRRVRLLRCPPGGAIVGTAIVAAGWLAYSMGLRSGVQAAWHLGAVLVAAGCALTVLGKHVLFRFLPAFLVLVFLIPVPGPIRQAISVPLQQYGASAAHALLQVFGVDSVLRGNTVAINGMDVAVAEACNGMRMVFALVLVSYAFAFGMPLRAYVRVLVLLASPLAALFCNVPRLAATVLVYGNASKSFADQFHDVSGWLMLPVAFMLLMAILKLLRWALLPVGRFTLAYQ